MISLILFLKCCLTITSYASQIKEPGITFVGRNVAIGKIFKQIEIQTGLRFMYASDMIDIDETITVDFRNRVLDEVLDILLSRKMIYWKQDGNTIILTKKKIVSDDLTSNVGNTRGSDPPQKISGRVIDVNGNPVPNATIIIKGTNKGTKTDGDGRFLLNGVDSSASLLITSIGFESKEVLAKGNMIVVKMNGAVGSLDEAIVVGYGITRQRITPGNVSSIKAKDITNQPVSDPLLTLSGRIPGLTVTQTTGLQGGAVEIQIRGRNTLNGGTQPLIIIDGVPYQANITAPLGNYGALGPVISALNFLNPSDIESIDVLKDADATAIYGSRGANGVILITTKKGKIGDMRVDLNFNSGIQNLSRKMDLLDTREYLEMRREAFKNDGEIPNIQNAPDLLLWDTTRFTDWHKEMVGGTGRYTDVQLGISGGTPNVQYLLGGNYHNESTIYPGDFSSQRGGAHLNITGISTNQRLKSVLMMSYVINKTDFPGGDFASQVTLPPNAPRGYNEDGTLNWENSSWKNPYAQLVSNIMDAKTNNIVANIDLSYRLTPELMFKANIGYNEIKTNTFSGTTIAGADPSTLSTARAYASYTYNTNRSWISEPQITYSKSIMKGNLDVLAGMTFLGSQNNNQFVFAGGILQDALIRFPAAATSYAAVGTGSNYKYAAFFGRLGYNYDNKYILNFTLRRDGSSRFGTRRQFANFGSIGIAWIFSEEKIFEEIGRILSFGKIRTSYGITGNDQIGDYRYLNQYEFVDQPYQGIKGTRVVGLFNPDFEWERTRKFEVGIETGFLKDRFLFSISHYRNFSDNQLTTYSLPVMTGNYGVIGNLPVVIRNTGTELVLSSTNVKAKNFKWTTAINLSISRNLLVSDEKKVLGNDKKEGKSLNVVPVYTTVGVDPGTGVYLFEDFDGKATSDLGVANGYSKLIDLTPAFFGGAQNSFSYKGFILDVFFQFTKQTGFAGLYSTDDIPGTMRNQPKNFLGRWRKEGDASEIQQASQSSRLGFGYRAFLSSDKSYVDASFIRLKNVAFSWIMPHKWSKPLHISNCRLYINGQNLFTLTKYPGWDPETRSVSSIPPLRVITTGIQLSF